MATQKVSEAMVRIYADLVRKEVRTLDSLPEIYKEPVIQYITNHPFGY